MKEKKLEQQKVIAETLNGRLAMLIYSQDTCSSAFFNA
jgi:hypothetical protein